MFEYFTEDAINIIMLAQNEARRLGYNFVSTELMLLGIMADNSSIAAKFLKERGLDYDKVCHEVENIIGHGAGNVEPEIPFTPEAKNALEAAFDISAKLGHNYIGQIHVLYGLIYASETIVCRVLKNLGIDIKELKRSVKENLAGLSPMPLLIKSPTSYVIFRKNRFILTLVLIFVLLAVAFIYFLRFYHM